MKYKVMKLKHVGLLLIMILLSISILPNAFALVRSNSTTITNFVNLCNAHPTVASYDVMGNRSILGNSIYVFRFGNPNGGCVMWISQIHGSEIIGTECMWIFANWLFGGSALANQYLQTNYVLMIPIVNIDTTNRQNMRRSYTFSNGTTIGIPYGVNLNRNFPHDWPTLGSGDPNNDYDYWGPAAASEPETKAVIEAWHKYRPKIFVDGHTGAGPLIYKNSYSSTNSTLMNAVVSLSHSYWLVTQPRFNGTIISEYPWSGENGGGVAAHDAVRQDDGIEASFLIEFDRPSSSGPETPALPSTMTALQKIEQYYYPKSLVFFLATLNATATFQARTRDITGPGGQQDGKCDMRDIGLVARYFGRTVPPAPANCDLTGPTAGVPDGIIDMQDIGLIAKHYGERYQ